MWIVNLLDRPNSIWRKIQYPSIRDLRLFALSAQLHASGFQLVSLWHGAAWLVAVAVGFRQHGLFTLFEDICTPRLIDVCLWHDPTRFHAFCVGFHPSWLNLVIEVLFSNGQRVVALWPV